MKTEAKDLGRPEAVSGGQRLFRATGRMRKVLWDKKISLRRGFKGEFLMFF